MSIIYALVATSNLQNIFYGLTNYSQAYHLVSSTGSTYLEMHEIRKLVGQLVVAYKTLYYGYIINHLQVLYHYF